MTKIYTSNKLGSIYWLEDGGLFYTPTPNDGIVDTKEDGGQVDYYVFKGEKTLEGEDITKLVKAIEAELRA